MKTARILLFFAALAMPVLAGAQTSQPFTRDGDGVRITGTVSTCCGNTPTTMTVQVNAVYHSDGTMQPVNWTTFGWTDGRYISVTYNFNDGLYFSITVDTVTGEVYEDVPATPADGFEVHVGDWIQDQMMDELGQSARRLNEYAW